MILSICKINNISGILCDSSPKLIKYEINGFVYFNNIFYNHIFMVLYQKNKKTIK